MMKKSFVFGALALLIAALPARAEEAAQPEQFVQTMADAALVALTDKNIARPVRAERVRDILEKDFDIHTIGRFAMGPYWNAASDDQRREYLDLFESMIVDAYTARFENFSGQTLKVTKSVAASETDTIVSSELIQAGAPPLDLDWRVRSKNGQMKIVDVLVDGISMSVTQRSDFSAVIQSGGGKIDALLASLRERSRQMAGQKA